MSEAVFSMLLLRVLGLVDVVPKLCCRPWPRRNAPPPAVGDEGDGNAGDPGAPDDPGEEMPPDTEFSSMASNPDDSSMGVAGLDSMAARCSSGSTRSGGRRSFSISDFRL